MNRWIRHIFFLLAMSLPMSVVSCVASDSGSESAAEEDIDVQGVIFGHIGDAYEWHITDIGDRSISIPLPVIVKSSTGWHCFLSSRLERTGRCTRVCLFGV